MTISVGIDVNHTAYNLPCLCVSYVIIICRNIDQNASFLSYFIPYFLHSSLLLFLSSFLPFHSSLSSFLLSYFIPYFLHSSLLLFLSSFLPFHSSLSSFLLSFVKHGVKVCCDIDQNTSIFCRTWHSKQQCYIAVWLRHVRRRHGDGCAASVPR